MTKREGWCSSCGAYVLSTRFPEPVEVVCGRCRVYFDLCRHCLSKHTFDGGLLRRPLCGSCVAEANLARLQ